MLEAYPATIRRRILRHLYLRHVRSSYLFEGCRQKFLDALLGISKVRINDNVSLQESTQEEVTHCRV